MRRKSSSSTRDRAFTSSVLPSPGTPSSSTLPPQKMAVSVSSTTRSWPTIICPISAAGRAEHRGKIVRLGLQHLKLFGRLARQVCALGFPSFPSCWRLRFISSSRPVVDSSPGFLGSAGFVSGLVRPALGGAAVPPGERSVRSHSGPPERTGHRRAAARREPFLTVCLRDNSVPIVAVDSALARPNPNRVANRISIDLDPAKRDVERQKAGQRDQKPIENRPRALFGLPVRADRCRRPSRLS